MNGLLAAALGVASAAVVTSVSLRCARSSPSARWPEALALGGAASVALLGIAGSLLGLFGVFDAVSMTLVCATLAVVLWPRGGRPVRRTRRPSSARRTALWLLLLLGAVALRLPATDASLAGRDQGTYVLRSAALARTGDHGFVDPILSAAGSANPKTRGVADLLGLHPKRSEPWRAHVYEAAYRPGWYLADRDRGLVVPQFFHLHPSLVAAYRLVVGEHAVPLAVVIQTLLLHLILLAVGRRCFGASWIALVPALVVAVCPLAVWVHRTPLSENPTSILLWGAVLAALRTRDHDPIDLDLAALLLGAMAWTRGNAWLALPVILATLWLLPGHAPRRRRPVAILTAVALGAVFAHAGSIYPYLVDEFAKQMWRGPMPTPGAAVAASAFGAAVWWLVDATSFHRRPDRGGVVTMRKLVPIALAVGCAVAMVTYLWLAAVSPPRPYARLEAVFPTFGPVLLALGAASIPAFAARTRLTRARDVWLAAIAASLVVNLLLYAQRNLPSAGLYYYGRYLAPGLLPLAALLAAASLAGLQRLTQGARTRLRRDHVLAHSLRVLPGGIALLLVGSVAYPLVATPVVRLQEFGGTVRLAQQIAQQTGPNANIIAGGEGWHAGHTFNQVGGALQMSHGFNVLPYRSREAFYTTAYALMLSEATVGADAPAPTFLLLAEATHHYERSGTSAPVAAFDDLLPPPFIAKRIHLLELFSDRLTPTVGRQPSRVTRDQLRMALVELGLDPARSGERRYAISGQGRLRAWTTDPEPAEPAEPACLRPKTPLTIELPPEASGPGSVVVVMVPGTAIENRTIALSIDGERRYPHVHAGSPRPGDTLGPITVDGDRHRLELMGFPHAGPTQQTCAHGQVDEVRWLGLDGHALRQADPVIISYPPPNDLGRTPRQHQWVAGRGLSKHRPLLDPLPVIEGLTLVLEPEAPINFAPAQLPGTAGDPLDVILTLTTTALADQTRVIVFADGERIGTLAPPPASSQTWRGPTLRFVPRRATARFSLTLEGASDGDSVRVRDIGLFSRSSADDAAQARVH